MEALIRERIAEFEAQIDAIQRQNHESEYKSSLTTLLTPALCVCVCVCVYHYSDRAGGGCHGDARSHVTFAHKDTDEIVSDIVTSSY